MKLRRLMRLFNIIKTTENNDAGSVMGFPLCCGNCCLLIQNAAGHCANAAGVDGLQERRSIIVKHGWVTDLGSAEVSPGAYAASK